MLSQKAISDFQKVYYQDFGEYLSEDEAQMMAQSLLEVMKIVFSIPK